MSLYDLATKIEFSRIDEDTTEANIAYLPCHVGATKDALRKLARAKIDWGIEVLETKEGFTVVFEDALTVTVPGNYWNAFQHLLDEQELSKTVKLQCLLDEQGEEEQKHLQNLRDELRKALRGFYSRKEFQEVFQYVDSWKRLWPDSRFIDLPKSVRIQFQKQNKDLIRLEEEIFAAYSDDRGGLEQTIESLTIGRSVEMLDGFKGYDFLYGARLEKHDIGILEVMCDSGLHVQVTVSIQDQELQDKLEENQPPVKCVGTVFFPKPGMAVEFFKKIRIAQEDILQGEDNAQGARSEGPSDV